MSGASRDLLVKFLFGDLKVVDTIIVPDSATVVHNFWPHEDRRIKIVAIASNLKQNCYSSRAPFAKYSADMAIHEGCHIVFERRVETFVTHTGRRRMIWREILCIA
jgi:hypothetical protein